MGSDTGEVAHETFSKKFYFDKLFQVIFKKFILLFGNAQVIYNQL